MGRTGEFEITVDDLPDGGTVLRVDGELDLATIRQLELTLEDVERSSRLVLDLTDCTFLDSSAVRVLVSTARSADAAGGSLALVTSDPGVLRVLEIAAVDTLLPVHPTVESAL